MKVEGLTGGPFFLLVWIQAKLFELALFLPVWWWLVYVPHSWKVFSETFALLSRVAVSSSVSFPHYIHHWFFNDEGKFICTACANFIRTLSFWIIITIEYKQGFFIIAACLLWVVTDSAVILHHRIPPKYYTCDYLFKHFAKSFKLFVFLKLFKQLLFAQRTALRLSSVSLSIPGGYG